MPAKTDLVVEKIRRRKRAIGVTAIVLLLLFTVLAFMQVISFITWILADLVVAGIANLLLRRIGKATPK